MHRKSKKKYHLFDKKVSEKAHYSSRRKQNTKSFNHKRDVNRCISVNKNKNSILFPILSFNITTQLHLR